MAVRVKKSVVLVNKCLNFLIPGVDISTAQFAFHSSLWHKINSLHNLLLLFSLCFFLLNFSHILLKKNQDKTLSNPALIQKGFDLAII